MIYKIVICLVFLASMARGEVLNHVFQWTAPGDDDTIGTATRYEMRFSSDSLIVAGWLDATLMDGVPDPSIAGSSESFNVNFNLPAGTYFFAIKTVDEAGNWSGISNIVRIYLPDITAPAPITDLR